MTDPDELRERIKAVYVALEDADSAHGALSWFAERAGVRRHSVSRWVTGERSPGGPVLALLESLEREADQ